jgi:hypothetical protein
MDVDLTNPTMWLSMLVGAAVLAAVSAFLQSQHEDAKPGEPLNKKAVITESVSSAATSAATTVASATSEATKKVASGADIDLQVGPARF